MDLDELKLFLRIDGDEENDLIEGLKTAAEEYLTNAGVNKNYQKKLYGLAVKKLVLHWYENPEVIGKTDETQFGLRGMITQLKYTQVEVTA